MEACYMAEHQASPSRPSLKGETMAAILIAKAAVLQFRILSKNKASTHELRNECNRIVQVLFNIVDKISGITQTTEPTPVSIDDPSPILCNVLDMVWWLAVEGNFTGDDDIRLSMAVDPAYRKHVLLAARGADNFEEWYNKTFPHK